MSTTYIKPADGTVIYLPAEEGHVDVDFAHYEPGSIVRVETPPGYYWRSTIRGFDVRARWWMRLWRAIHR